MYRAGLTITLTLFIFLGEFSVPGRSQEESIGPFVVAHNAGDTSEALSSEWVLASDVIEIDVLFQDGALVAGHPVSFFTVIVSIEKTLPTPVAIETAWDAVRSAVAIQLDMKSNSPSALHLLIDFLHLHANEKHVLVTAQDPLVLRAIRQHPDVCRYLSLPRLSAINSLLDDPELLAILDGVAVREQLLDKLLLERFHEAGLQVLAWTVNEPARAAELVEWGVDGITTDRTEIAIAYGGGGSGASQLCDRE